MRVTETVNEDDGVRVFCTEKVLGIVIDGDIELFAETENLNEKDDDIDGDFVTEGQFDELGVVEMDRAELLERVDVGGPVIPVDKVIIGDAVLVTFVEPLWHAETDDDLDGLRVYEGDEDVVFVRHIEDDTDGDVVRVKYAEIVPEIEALPDDFTVREIVGVYV